MTLFIMADRIKPGFYLVWTAGSMWSLLGPAIELSAAVAGTFIFLVKPRGEYARCSGTSRSAWGPNATRHQHADLSP